ncbi:MAG: 2-succinyl-5-enolpyruvyl-6-hydroxy-3-cyclohexene-1-carboxylic-acid synthase [Tannerellaceae bacterium]|jgi:2-succinyl-5-enolpyruvyl-6-hydroxy-3-cyclohexene-1-carboxylate synthase|nr:2-succinyl-5-enolpyruvyl-6-hydroxy-3-cyclohexene-1-carboxylic-acid synthase [Tannerellaceae bacterium]
MYSDKKNILQLVALMKEHLVSRVVISPGARNFPIAQSLAECGEFSCYSVVDERSAGFMALGMAQFYSKYTVALCCTSGSAALNYAPAVAEAWHRNIPLLIITADRPAAWLGQLENQIIRQSDIFGSFVKMSVTLPEIRTKEDEWHCNRLINEALLEVNYSRPGPVHINIPIPEPLFEFPVETLPKVRVIRRDSLKDSLYTTDDINRSFGDRFGFFDRPMILLGQQDYNGVECMIIPAVFEHVKGMKCVLLGEHLAVTFETPTIIRNFDSILHALPESAWSSYAPDLLITTGGQVISKQIKKFLRTHKPREHWHVSPWGEIVDTYQCLTHAITSTFSRFIDALMSANHEKPPRETLPYFTGWYSFSEQIPPPTPDYSSMMAIGELMKAITGPAELHLANSSAVRHALLFPLKGRIEVRANRGTSGIEGCVSTALGAAISKMSEPTYVITGDLAFFTDINALWNYYIVRRTRLRILLNNNGGGAIFGALEGFYDYDIESHNFALALHNTSAKEWALDRGIAYLEVHNADDLRNYMPAFIDREVDGTIIMEVFSNTTFDNYELYAYHDSIKL